MTGRERPEADCRQLPVQPHTPFGLNTISERVMMLILAIDRDSVHPGDDLISHANSVKLDPTATLRIALEAIQAMHYLGSTRTPF
jgi:hypothetical protein